MKEGLEEFLKRIEAKPTNETLIDRFVTLVLEEEVLERVLYLKKLVGLLLTPNPYAALKAAALELQEARKEKLTKEYEVGALKDVESCFLKLDKMDNAQLVREEINKLQSEMSREQTSSRSRTAPPPNLPQVEQVRDNDIDEDDDGMGVPPARQARVHFRLPKPQDDEEPEYEERTKRNVPSEYEAPNPPAAMKSGQRAAPSPDSFPPKSPPSESSFNPDAFSYLPKKRASTPEASSSFTGQKEFYDKNLEEPEEDRDAARRSSLSRVSGLKVGPNLLEEPDEREQAPRPRNIASVFETTDAFSSQKSAGQGNIELDRNQRSEPDLSAKAGKSEAQKAKNKLRTPFESSDYTSENITSNSMFQESQHVHFPENTSNRSMTKQELRAVAAHEHTARHSSSPPLENTEILPDSRRMMEPDDYDDDEATRQLDPEELIRASMPAEPAFPPREFDVPPFELAPKKAEPASIPKSAPAVKETPKKNRDPFDALRETERDFFNSVKGSQPPVQDPFAVVRQASTPVRDIAPAPKETNDPFAGIREPAPLEVRTPSREAFAPAREMAPENLDPFAAPGPIGLPKEAQTFPKEVPTQRPAPAVQNSSPREAQAARPAPPIEPKWNLLRDRLRLLSGVQISRSHANDFVLRLLGENARREEQQQVLSILMRVLDSQKQALAEQRFLAFLFEELHPKALHQLLGALKIGDQTVVFFVDYLHSLVKDRQLRRTLNVIHAVIVPGLDLSWYQEAYRFLLLVWPELGLKGWHWLEEEGPMAFCDRLSEREDLFPATLLA